MSGYVSRCQVCGRDLQAGMRRKVTVANEVMRDFGNGMESGFKARSHVIVCEACARKVEYAIERAMK